MATVHADSQDRKRIVFTARDRSIVNVRERVDDGLIGYDSTELLLITLGNCTLGWLLSNRLLKDEEVIRAEATLNAEMVEAPIRVAKIDVAIEIDVADPTLLEHAERLDAVSRSCPIRNTLVGVDITSSLSLAAVPAAQ